MSTSLKKENNKPLIIGLTGGIGSGKSTVAKIFHSFGVPIFNSDIIAKKIINTDESVIEQITAQFGTVYQNKKLDNIKMAAIVFSDKKALEKLNNIIHPKVASYFKKWINEHKKQSILIKEAAILIESGAYLQMDKIILVTAPTSIRIKRVITRDNVEEEKVQERMKAQLSDEKKATYADFTIINDDKQMLIPQILTVFEKLTVIS